MLEDKVAVEALKLGIFFFILFTSFLSFQNIVTHVYQEQGLTGVGPLNLIVNYLSFLISNTLAVKCKLSFKVQMLIGSLAYSVNMSTGIFVPYIENHSLIYGIVALGGIIGGVSAGFLWVSQGGYLREVCKGKENKGKYNAIFTLMLSLSSATAGIMTTFFLGYFSNQVYFIALTTLSLFSSVYCLLFLKNISQNLSQSQDLLLNSNESALEPQSSIISQQNLDQLNSSQEQSVLKNVINSLKYYKKMIFALIFLTVDGLVLGIQSNQMTKLIPDQMKQDHDDFNLKAGILTIFIGVGSMIGSWMSGPATDGFGLKCFAKTTVFAYVFTCVLTVAAALEKTYWLACVISFLWGFTYYLFEGWIFVSILKIFEGKLEAFAINKQVHCISMAGFQVLVILTENQFDIKILMFAIVGLALPLALCLFKIDFSKEIFGKELKKVKSQK